MKSKLIRSIIIEHLQGNLPYVEENKNIFRKTILILRKIWSISDSDIEMVQNRYGNLTQLLSFLKMCIV